MVSAPRRESRLDLEGLAAFERSKRRRRHRAAPRADVLREQARQKATGEPHREAEGAGQMALDLEEREAHEIASREAEFAIGSPTSRAKREHP